MVVEAVPVMKGRVGTIEKIPNAINKLHGPDVEILAEFFFFFFTS